MYAASALREGVDPVMKVIADTVLRPKITEEEVKIFDDYFSSSTKSNKII